MERLRLGSASREAVPLRVVVSANDVRRVLDLIALRLHHLEWRSRVDRKIWRRLLQLLAALFGIAGRYARFRLTDECRRELLWLDLQVLWRLAESSELPVLSDLRVAEFRRLVFAQFGEADGRLDRLLAASDSLFRGRLRLLGLFLKLG